MRIAVISDLRLGRRDAADHFGHDDSGFLRFLSEAAVWAGAWLRRMRLRAMFRMFQALDTRLTNALPDPARRTFQRWALARAHDSGADIVVTGHTHLGLRVEHGSRLFLNSGTCSEGQFSFPQPGHPRRALRPAHHLVAGHLGGLWPSGEEAGEPGASGRGEPSWPGTG